MLDTNFLNLETKLWHQFSPLANLPQAAMATSKAQSMGQAMQPTVHEVDFPYYSLREGFDATLHLVSDSPEAISFVLSIHSMKGEPLALPQMTIGPQQSLALNLGNLLKNRDGKFAEGSISVWYQALGSMPIAGQVTMENSHLHLVYESRMTENDPGMSDIPSTLNALWWNVDGDRDAVFAVSNVAGDPAEADLSLDFGGVQHAAGNLQFVAHETKLLSLKELLRDFHVNGGIARNGGITINFRGPAPNMPSLIAQGRILDPANGFSTTLNFPSASTLLRNSFHASGVPIGTPSADSPYAGLGNFTPHVIARNLSPSAQTVTITLEEPGSNGANLDGLPQLTLQPYSTQDVAITPSLTQLSSSIPFLSIRLQHSGNPGSLIAEVSSIDEHSDLVVDSHLANEGDPTIGSGANPWHVDSDTESIFFVTNMSGDAAKALLQVQAQGVHYYFDVKLQPYQTKAISIRALRDAQKTDIKGNKLPLNASDGNLNWIHGPDSQLVGRVVTINRGEGITSNYSCTTCGCGYQDEYLEIDPGSSTIVAGDSNDFSATAWYQQCDGSWFSDDVTFSATWSSSNNSVASVTSGTVFGNTAGSATIYADFTDDSNCSFDFSTSTCSCSSSDFNTSIIVNVTDTTPQISSVSPSPWNAGSSGLQIQINGAHFGTNMPGLTITDPSNGVHLTSIYSWGDREIVAYVNIDANDAGDSATITVTNKGYGGQGFTSTPGTSATGPSASVTINPIPAPVPQILFNGNPVAGTPSVVVGQQIPLGSSVNVPGGTVITSQSWNIPGNPIAGYNASSSSGQVVQLLRFTDASITFYWPFAGTAGQVQNQVTYSYCLNNNQCNSANATFAVTGFGTSGAAGQMIVTSPNNGNLTIDNLTGCSANAGGPTLVYGNVSGPAPGCTGTTTGTPGILFNEAGTQPSANGGFSFVQLISTDSRSYTKPGATFSCSSTAGIDTSYPYAGHPTPTSATDAPETPLPSTYTTASRTFDATMYIMWNPLLPSGCGNSNGTPGPTCTSIPVPMASQEWRVSGSTTQTNGTWGTPTPSPAGGPTGTLVWPAGSYPQWTGIATESCP